MTQPAEVTFWLQPQVIVPVISTILASVIIPILLHHLKYKRERAEMVFKARKEAYEEYFKKFEKSAASIGQEYDKYTNEILPQAFLKLLHSSNSPEGIVEFQATVGSFPHNIQESHRSVLEEMTTLQIFASPTLLTLIKQYEDLHREMMVQAAPWLQEANKKLTAPDLESPIADEMKLRGTRIESLKNEIIAQMRAELGTDR
ncbi:MAG: hypothetical protein PHH28_15245 [Desulfuromonadaceae bacterium]|nr:hypothetical protein [Desulfuromonadaceae bacterium]